MTKKVGLWIDHRKAVIVSITNDKEQIRSIKSDMGKHVRFSGEAQAETEEDIRERRFMNNLNKYYDKVIESVRDAEAILIVGPGEAKVEFKKRLDNETQNSKVVGLEAVDKMTEPQIAAKVREHFSN